MSKYKNLYVGDDGPMCEAVAEAERRTLSSMFVEMIYKKARKHKITIKAQEEK